MKKIVLIVMIILGTRAARAQAPIPNGDFEEWSNGSPVGWTTDDTTIATQSFLPITQTSDAENGSSAMKGTVTGVGFGGMNVAQIPPLLISGKISGNDTGGFAYSDHPNSITGFYKFSPVGEDSILIIVVFKKHGAGIGGGSGYLAKATSSYTAFTIPINWSSSDAPDTAMISISIPAYGGTSNVGTTMEIDNLAFSNGTNSVGASAAIPLSLDNFPNPLLGASATSIAYSLSEAGYTTLTLYDMEGRAIKTCVQEFESAGPHLVTVDCSSLPVGTYTYRLTSGGRMISRMLQILR